MGRLLAAFAMALALLVVSPVSRAQAPRTIKVVMTSYKFEPSRIEMTAGEHVVLQLVNEDLNERNHNLQTPLFLQIPLTVRGDVFADKSTADVRFIAVAPGKAAEVEFTAPEAGTYPFVCSIPGHTPRGMTGAFAVASPP